MPGHEPVSGHPALSHTKLHIGHSFVWTHLFPESSQVPKTRAKHATCLHNGSIYLYGGICGNSALKDMWRLEPGSCLWTRLECRGESPPVLQEHTMVGYKESIYIFGGLCGFDNPGETALWVLDLKTFTWSKQVIDSEVTTPASRRGHSVVLHEGGMHLFGGHVDLKGSCNELWTLDFETLYWHTSVYNNQEPSPPPRHSHSAVLHGNTMYIYGGSSNLQPLKDLWTWDFGSRQWSRVRFWQGPPALHGHSALSLGDSMLVYGGQNGTGAHKNDLWIFSYSSESWTKVAYRGSIVPSPTVHQTLHMDIPDPLALFPPQDERSLSAPFLQRASLASLHVKPLSRPHSSPPYALHSGSTRPGSKERFRNRVHPTTRPRDAAVSNGDHGNQQPASDDSEEECEDSDGSVDEEDVEGDPYRSRIFIPVQELMNSSKEHLLQSDTDLASTKSAKMYKTLKITLEEERIRRMRKNQAKVNTMQDMQSIDSKSLSQCDSLEKEKKVDSLPQVRIEHVDGPSHDKMQSFYGGLQDDSMLVDMCNNQKKFSLPPTLVQVLPRTKSDEISLIPLNGSVDDLNLNDTSKKHGRFAFENAGFTMTDHCSLSSSQARSASMNSLVHNLNAKNLAEERHQSLSDLPNMASLILQRREGTQRPYRQEPARPGARRPKLKHRSQTDQALYNKTRQFQNEGYESGEPPEPAGGRGSFHLPFPVHLYVLGGQEPNVSSLHKYQTPMPIFRCTIVPGKPSPLEVQTLLR